MLPATIPYARFSKSYCNSERAVDIWTLSKECLDTKELQRYLYKRPEEPSEVYWFRLNNSTFTPLLHNLVQMVLGAVTKEGVSVSTEQPQMLAVTNAIPVESFDWTQLVKVLLTEGDCVVVPDMVGEMPKLHFIPYSKCLDYQDDWVAWKTVTVSRGVLIDKEEKRETLHLCHKEHGHAVYVSTNEQAWILDQERSVPSINYLRIQCDAIGKLGMDKQKQYLRIESSATDTAIQSGYVQRVLTPVSADDDLTTPFDEDSIVSSNATVITAKDFQFREMTGAVLDKLDAFMSRIKNEMFAIVGLDVSNTDKAQSGEAKVVDLSRYVDYLMDTSEYMREVVEDCYLLYLSWIYGQEFDKDSIEIQGFSNLSSEQQRKQRELSISILERIGEYLSDEQKVTLTNSVSELFNSTDKQISTQETPSNV